MILNVERLKIRHRELSPGLVLGPSPGRIITIGPPANYRPTRHYFISKPRRGRYGRMIAFAVLLPSAGAGCMAGWMLGERYIRVIVLKSGNRAVQVTSPVSAAVSLCINFNGLSTLLFFY